MVLSVDDSGMMGTHMGQQQQQPTQQSQTNNTGSNYMQQQQGGGGFPPQQPAAVSGGGAAGSQQCIRQGCHNPAVSNPEWEDEYCSNECVVTHCRDVFNSWVALNPSTNSIQSYPSQPQPP